VRGLIYSRMLVYILSSSVKYEPFRIELNKYVQENLSAKTSGEASMDQNMMVTSMAGWEWSLVSNFCLSFHEVMNRKERKKE